MQPGTWHRSLITLLAQAGAPTAAQGTKASSTQVLAWSGVLIVIIMVGWIVLMWLRRKILTGDSAFDQTQGLMASLKELRDSGQMSTQEYDTARKAMATRIAQKMDSSTKTAKARPAPDAD